MDREQETVRWLLPSLPQTQRRNLSPLLLRLALAAGLTQRELFIEKVSAFLSEKTDSSPENGERIAAGLVSLAESLKDELFLREIFAAQSRSGSDPDGTLASRIEELNETLRELTTALKQHP